MNRLVVLLTVAMSLSHALFGCDAHHVRTEACVSQTQVDCDQHDHDLAPQRTPNDGQPPCHEDGCCHLTCKWLLPDVVGDMAPELLWHATVLSEDQLSGSQSSHSLLQAIAPADSLLALPVRSHLAVSVLLI
jgi:hypothetical protein